jgi:hypothetical protein
MYELKLRSHVLLVLESPSPIGEWGTLVTSGVSHRGYEKPTRWP